MSIATEISRIQTATNDIKTAITGKGVSVPTGSQIDDLPALITSIPTGGGSGLLLPDIIWYCKLGGQGQYFSGIIDTSNMTTLSFNYSVTQSTNTSYKGEITIDITTNPTLTTTAGVFPSIAASAGTHNYVRFRSTVGTSTTTYTLDVSAIDNFTINIWNGANSGSALVKLMDITLS